MRISKRSLAGLWLLGSTVVVLCARVTVILLAALSAVVVGDWWWLRHRVVVFCEKVAPGHVVADVRANANDAGLIVVETRENMSVTAPTLLWARLHSCEIAKNEDRVKVAHDFVVH